jgi:putative ABC transport system permease protein
MAGYQLPNDVYVTAPGRMAERAQRMGITPNLLSTLGILPREGRDFQPDETGRSHVAIVTDALWRRAFAASPAAIGTVALFDGTPYTIVGVLPPGFLFPWFLTPDIYVPLPAPTAASIDPVFPILTTIGRLRAGISLEEAQARLEAATREHASSFPWVKPVPGVTRVVATPLRSHLGRYGRDPQSTLSVMMAAAACMLLISCANVANLFLARGLAREKEVAMRAALGATRWRLVRLLMAESALVTATGSVLAVALACLAAPYLRFLLPDAIPQAPPLDWRVLAFTAGCMVGVAMLVVLAPALAACRLDLAAATKEAGVSLMARPARGRLRGGLAVAQLALSLALLAGGGLLLRSFAKLVQVDVGFDPQNLLATEIKPKDPRSYRPERSADYYTRALAELRSLDGVEAVGLSSQTPLSAVGFANRFVKSESAPGATMFATSADAGYFNAMRIPILAGRAFQEGDGPDSEKVAILSQAAAHVLFGDENPLGRRIASWLSGKTEYQPVVVGVVGDVRHNGYSTRIGWPETYLPVEQWPQPDMSIVVRSRVDPATLQPVMSGVLQVLDPSQKAPAVKPMGELLADSAAPQRQRGFLLGVFAAISLLVAAIGVYGVVTYSVTRRTHEIGVRMSLGAQSRDVRRMVLGEGLRLAFAGGAIGLGLALALSRMLSSFLFGIGPWDGVTFLISVVTLVATACLASYLPARRATRVNPAVALRRD